MPHSTPEPSAAERAYREIRTGILEGRYAPGRMLGEAPLAAELGVSRTPIRAAITRLQDEGWITVYPKRGAFVHGLNDRELAELADARLVLESTAVSRAPAELRGRLADELERSIDDQRKAFDAGDVRAFIDLTLAFHRGFVQAGGNGVLLELYDRLLDRHRFKLFASGDHLLSRCDEIIAEHCRLTTYLRAGDTAAFAEALRGHIDDAGPVPDSLRALDGLSGAVAHRTP